MVTEVVARLVEDAGQDAARWIELVDSVSDLQQVDREAVLTDLRISIEAERFSDSERAVLWESIRSLIARHRTFADAEWALPADELAKIEEIQTALEPKAPAERHGWLFQSYDPPLSDTSRRADLAAYDAELSERRKAAIAEIDTNGGYPALLHLARKAMHAGWVGWAIAAATQKKYETKILPLLGTEDPIEAALSWSFAASRFRQVGWKWVEAVVLRPLTAPLQRAILLLVSSDYPKAWVRADELGAEVADEFWKHFPPYGLGADFAYAEYAGERLIRINRNAAALKLIQLYLQRAESNVEKLLILAASALEALNPNDDPESAELRDYGFRKLFAHFFEHKELLGSTRIARLEWAYLPALGFDAEPRMLGDLLASDPDFFVSVVSAIYKPRSAERASTVPADDVRRAEKAYRVLNNWSVLPGLREDGGFDAEALADWVKQAVKGLTEADRLNAGLNTFGQALGRLPAQADQDWPNVAVCELIENLRHKKLDEGFYMGVINSRGTVSRALDAGGNMERKLGTKYSEAAERLSDQWPRTAAIFRALADHYNRDARSEDSSAERFRQGLEE